ncbi:MAG TPA: type II toxin-antitoxin system VapC family toxin [Bryobacteraceae bacterium]|jgi:predicted nucleic acid-binding protein|nr:type II toxin-antitoxin system VapC family toxin [Bryobacteraceae bacterium]
MVAAPACLLDSNILLRTGKVTPGHYPDIELALDLLVRGGFKFCFTSQTLGEFWNVCTRPANRNGYGLSVAATDVLAKRIESEYDRLPETSAVHDHWRALLIQHQIKGAQVHDARIAAAMYVHGVTHILTLNDRDFLRFPGIRVLRPGEIGETSIR